MVAVEAFDLRGLWLCVSGLSGSQQGGSCCGSRGTTLVRQSSGRHQLVKWRAIGDACLLERSTIRRGHRKAIILGLRPNPVAKRKRRGHGLSSRALPGVFPMINEARVRDRAKAELATNEVRFVREIPIGRPGCSLSLWIEHGPMPPRGVALLETDECLICTSNDPSSFGRLFKIVRPDLTNYVLLGKLFREAAPGRMRVVDSEASLGWLPR